MGSQRRDHLVDRLMWTGRQAQAVDEKLETVRPQFPQVEALLELHGVGLFTALMIVAEYGEVERFCSAKQVAAYTGLTTRVYQSGDTCRTGHISKQGSNWLRWVLVEAAMKLVSKDVKLSEICWKRLRRWERQHGLPAAA